MKKSYKFTKLVNIGDIVFISICFGIILFSFFQMINLPRGEYIKIEDGTRKVFVFSLESNVEKKIGGPLGDTIIVIQNNKARIQSSPCNKKYCIHQGWINKINETIVCIPNKISLSIIGKTPNYDSINY